MIAADAGRPAPFDEKSDATREMIRAGVDALDEARGAFDDYEIVARVYSAMRRQAAEASSS